MKRLISLSGGALLAATALLVLPLTASAGDKTTCDGVLAPGSYGKVIVPDGAACFGEGNVDIRGGVDVGEGATFLLGSEETPDNTSTISGGVTADNPMNLQIHFATIDGGIKATGGAGPFGGPFEVTWTTIEDSTINGNVKIEGYNGFWMGFIRNVVNGNVQLNDNVLVDPDGNEYVTNTIHGSLDCSGNSPAPQVGDSEGSPNVVSGKKKGQCADV